MLSLKSTDLRDSHPEYIAEGVGADIRLIEDAEIFVTFLHEGAGYKNSFGYFTYTDETIPTSPDDVEVITIFPNASYRGAGGGLVSGDTVNLGVFEAGTRIGFAIASNGWNSSRRSVSNQFWDFYSLSALNEEPSQDLKKHTALLYYAGEDRVVIGFEDIVRTSGSCDHDFNDVVFTVRTTPVDAFDPTDLVSVPALSDSDNDGVGDSIDNFPNDPDRSTESYFPSRDQFGSIAFEDLWPDQGDYDLNDFVVRYRYKLVHNNEGDIKDIEATFTIQAVGANLKNGLAVRLPVSPADISEVTLDLPNENESSVIPESGQTDLVVQIFTNAFDYVVPSDGYRFVNTEVGSPEVESEDFVLKITFVEAKSIENLGSPPYDVFIFRTDDRTHEIHTSGFGPTDLFNSSLLNTGDDASSASEGRFFVTEDNLPWGIVVPWEWDHMKEGNQITWGYPLFVTWANSGGESGQNWYLDSKRTKYLWRE